MNTRIISHPVFALSLSLGLVLSLGIWSGCTDTTLISDSDSSVTLQSSVDQEALSKATAAQNRVEDDLLSREGIEGIGTGVDADGRPRIVIYARSPAAAAAANLPDHVEGIPTSVAVTGIFVARADETSKARPAPIGFSVGHPDITAGTIGARVRDGAGNVYILSNNHVLANSNDAAVGDATLQPGPFDGGSSADQIGTLADFKPISFTSNNIMDAAIAVVNGAELNGATPGDEGYGAPGTDPRLATLGMEVQKYGRTTGHTHGSVAEVNVTVNICYVCANPVCTRCASSARFVDQIAISDGSFSSGGDSGSLIVTTDHEKNPVGLLFAGSSSRTLANPIGPVLNHFKVVIDQTVNDDNSGDPANSLPTASFTFVCSDRSCAFDGAGSFDADGTLDSYAWDFGDGSEDSGVSVDHTYSTDGDYTVTLTVTDNEGASDDAIQIVSVSQSDGGDGGGDGAEFALAANGYKVRGLQKADLTWSGTSSANVDVFRNGSKIETIANDGSHTDHIDNRGGGSYTYQLCEAGDLSTCSNESTVTF